MTARIIHGILTLFLLLAAAAPAQAQLAPWQPLLGPGGRVYTHGAVTSKGPYWAEGFQGNDNYKYYIFQPASPTPAQAPVVLFLHAWQATNPNEYPNWISHMVRKGYVVVWVQYQAGLAAVWNYPKHAEAAWKDALKRLQYNYAEAHVRPEIARSGDLKTAFVGHSAGAYIAAIIAAKIGRTGDGPVPSAVVSIEPGRRGLIPTTENFATIDPATKFVMVVGDVDDVVCTSTATFVWNSMIQIPDENKDYLLVRSDTRGYPAQLGNHFFPNNTGTYDTAAVDARDYYVSYKLSVAALNCALKGTDCEYALGNGDPRQLDMGKWSDGVAVKPLGWIANPDSLVPIPACVGR